MRRIIQVISITATVLAIIWFAFQPSFEPAITALIGIASLLGTYAKEKPSAPQSNKRGSERRKSILYIDDELINSRFDMLEDSGYRVIPAETADKALKETKKNKFDLIILDIMMPPPKFVSKQIVHGGYETGILLAKRIKDGINKDTPIIVVTANPMAEVENALRAIGISAYLRKPIKHMDLEEEIVSALA